jgi:GTP-binding protein HflX
MAKKSNAGGRQQTNSTRHPGATDNVPGRVGRLLAKGNKDATYDTAVQRETAVLVAVPDKRQAEARTQEYLDELAFLAETAGVEVQHRFVQRLDKPDIRTFVGEGKLAEIKAYVNHKGIGVVIFDDDLSPSQLRNLEAELAVKIVDRSLLIIDIFATRAKSATARAHTNICCPASLASGVTWTSSGVAA